MHMTDDDRSSPDPERGAGADPDEADEPLQGDRPGDTPAERRPHERREGYWSTDSDRDRG
jgi:hypothetical protein